MVSNIVVPESHPDAYVSHSQMAFGHGSAIHHRKVSLIKWLCFTEPQSESVLFAVASSVTPQSVDENGDENGLRVFALRATVRQGRILPIVHRSRRRSRKPKRSKNGGERLFGRKALIEVCCDIKN